MGIPMTIIAFIQLSFSGVSLKGFVVWGNRKTKNSSRLPNVEWCIGQVLAYD